MVELSSFFSCWLKGPSILPLLEGQWVVLCLLQRGSRKPRCLLPPSLPSRFQGVEFNSAGDPVHYVSRPKGVSVGGQRKLVVFRKGFAGEVKTAEVAEG